MKKRGFTLVEIMIVVSIIALLMAILLPVLSSARRHVNEAKCQTQLVQLSHAIEIYRQEAGMYPPPGNLGPALRQAKKLPEILTCPMDPDRVSKADTYNILYNYYGYQESAPPTPIANRNAAQIAYLPKTVITDTGKLYWRSEGGVDGSPDSDFPGLLNPTPPRNTIVTVCPYHKDNKSRYMILRVDGSVDFTAPTSSTTFWMLSEKIKL